MLKLKLFRSFHATGLFLHPLKTSGNRRFSSVFRDYKKRPVIRSDKYYVRVKTHNSFITEAVIMQKPVHLLCKSMGWFLYENDLRHERVNLKDMFKGKIYTSYCQIFPESLAFAIYFTNLVANKITAKYKNAENICIKLACNNQLISTTK